MILCGWCHEPTDDAHCVTCGHDPRLPWTQRGLPAPVVDAAALARRRLADARRRLGHDATIDALAEHLDVSPRTVRRWREMAR